MTAAYPIQPGWTDPDGPTAVLRRLYPLDRPSWLHDPWRWTDGMTWTYAVEPDHLDTTAVSDLAALINEGFAVRIEAVPTGGGLLVQLRQKGYP